MCFWQSSSVFGKIPKIEKCFWEAKKGGSQMRKKNFKGRVQKRVLSKSKEVVRTYDAIQYAYADVLQDCDDVVEIRCNVLLDGLEDGEYTSDFVCKRTNGDWFVRECVFRSYLTKPMTVKQLDISREYWLRRGIKDFGVVTDEEK